MDTTLIAGLAIGGVFALGMALGFWWMIRRGGQIMVEQNARIARSQPARAKVLQIGKSVAEARNSLVHVKLRMDVMPSGAEAYPATTVWEIQAAVLSQIQPERTVAVKVDPDDPLLIYPNESWAEFSKLYWEAWVKDKRKKGR